MYNEETGEYETVVPDEGTEYGYAPDLSGGSNTGWGDNRQPVGMPTPAQIASTQDSSMNERGRGDQLGMSNMWERTTANILQAVAQTGINVYAQRNGVYGSQLPQNTQSIASPRQRQQHNQPLLMLALIVGAVIVLKK